MSNTTNNMNQFVYQIRVAEYGFIEIDCNELRKNRSQIEMIGKTTHFR